MKTIIPPVDRSLLLSELNPGRFIRKTNNGNNEIYIVNAHNSPNLMREIGRLREITFRQAGGGTGKELDVDKYDLATIPYQQLIVWNPQDAEIIGGYRFICCGEAPADEHGDPMLATSSHFNFSERFRKDFLPYTIELGRSFVQPKYQPGNDPRKGLFSLDNIWDGLGAIVVDYPQIKYFFGKVTMYLHFNQKARDLILYFLSKYFPDSEHLVSPREALPLHGNPEDYEPFFHGLDYKEGFKVLNTEVRALGENIPPLVNIYMNLSPTMKTFGTMLNHTFGEVEETGIMVTIADIHEAKKERHINSYLAFKNQA
jgi:hypothetical protein